MPFWNQFANTAANEKEGLSLIQFPTCQNPLSKDIKLLLSEDYEELIIFWKTHFGSPPRTPTLVVNPKWLQADAATGNFGFRLRGWKGVVYGRKMGSFYLSNQTQQKQPIYLIEGLTLQKEQRSKGLTPLLLDACVEHLQRTMPDTRFFFIKEGKRAPTDCLASDMYMYRRLRSSDKKPSKALKAEEATTLFTELSKGSASPWLTNEFGLHNSRTSFYATRCRRALMAITETHQCHHLDGQRLGLITGWITSAPLHESIKLQEELLAAQPYVWIWTPSSYVSDPTPWLQDGSISYQPFLFTVKPQVKMDHIFLAF